ncbi:MAG: hypothetical protein LBP35_00365 [Candidatus Ancillula trichonymphae]|jgi:hypothetical protein|nr:hypothetical protein [Candidatus Ancillula trichonymphae]
MEVMKVQYFFVTMKYIIGTLRGVALNGCQVDSKLLQQGMYYSREFFEGVQVENVHIGVDEIRNAYDKNVEGI